MSRNPPISCTRYSTPAISSSLTRYDTVVTYFVSMRFIRRTRDISSSEMGTNPCNILLILSIFLYQSFNEYKNKRPDIRNKIFSANGTVLSTKHYRNVHRPILSCYVWQRKTDVW